ncbi:MAG: hypothetical protein AAFQ07_15380, partial [Chloroflexota bacterium]
MTFDKKPKKGFGAKSSLSYLQLIFSANVGAYFFRCTPHPERLTGKQYSFGDLSSAWEKFPDNTPKIRTQNIIHTLSSHQDPELFILLSDGMSTMLGSYFYKGLIVDLRDNQA